MRAALDEFSVMENENQIGVGDGAETMGHCNRGPARDQLAQCGLHFCLDLAVDGTGRFVENEQGRVGGDCAGEGQQLPLANADRRSASTCR